MTIQSDITALRLVAKRATELADRLERNGCYSLMAQFDLLQLCNAMIDVVPDGDCMTERDNIAQSNGWDEVGNPLRGVAA